MLELESLSEIYDKDILHYSNDLETGIVSGEFVAHTKLNTEKNRVIIIGNDDKFSVSFLPPIHFNFKFDSSIDDMPEILISSNWLSVKLHDKLTNYLDSLIIENFSEKFWHCFEYLENESLKFLIDNIQNDNDDLIINLNDIYSFDEKYKINDLLEVLKQHDKNRTIIQFNGLIHECQICFMNKYGKECIQTSSCSHVLCKECIQKNFDTRLSMGYTTMVCPVCTSELCYNELKSLMKAETFTRWDNLLLNKCVKSLDERKMCPRCQHYIPVNLEEEYGFCKTCRHTFCLQCTETYNGAQCCRYKSKKYGPTEKVENPEEEKVKRNNFFHNKQSEQFLTEHFGNCPKCGVAYQRVGTACYHMVCSLCDTNFCFLCMKELPYLDPKSHFKIDCTRNMSRKEKSNLRMRLKCKERL